MTDSAAARRLRLALDMYEIGERMQRARLRRMHPDASDEDIEAALRRAADDLERSRRRWAEVER